MGRGIRAVFLPKMQPTNMIKCSRHGAENQYCEQCLENAKALEAERHHEAAYKQGYEAGLEYAITRAAQSKNPEA
jgi:hypothetical protein